MPDSLERKALLLCEQALEQPTTKREAWVRDACGSDFDLLSRVTALLSSIDPTGVKTTDEHFPLHIGTPTDPISPSKPPPETLGAYRLVELIGEGGMGSVYKAERADGAFDRTVAIKLVGAVRSRSDAEVRFTTERQILARMQHPNIAQLLDGGTEQDRGYLVMEYINGQPFDFDKDRDETATLNIFRKVCAAVQYAHNNLVLHRDIKPDNVLLDEAGEPKLLDFGIAKLDQEFSATGSADLTGKTAIPLTLNYSAPERLLGESATVSSDVYSLGVYLFVLMNGIRPYDLTGKTLPEAWKLLKDRTYQEASGQTGDLGAIAMKAMHNDVAERYSSASELAADINRYQQGRTVTAQTPDWRYSLKMFIARNRLAVSAGTLGVLALLGAFAMTGMAYLESERQKQIASQQAITATQTVDFLTNILSSANPWVTDQKESSVGDVLILARKNLDEGLIENPAARSYIETSLALAHDGRGEYTEAVDYAKSAVALLETNDMTGFRAANAFYVLGLAQVHADQTQDSVASFETAISHNTLQTTEDIWLRVEIETALGSALEARAEEDSALAVYQTARERAIGLTALNSDAMVVLENNLGRLLHKRGEYDDAISHYTSSLEISSRNNNNLRSAISLSNIAGIHGDKKEWTQAIELFKKSLAIHEVANTQSSPDAIITLASLANVQRRSGDIEAAEFTIESAHKVSHQTLGEEHFITAYVQNVAAVVLCDANNWRQGLDYAKRSLATRKKILPPTHWTLYSARSVLGACETSAGNYAVAEELLTNAYEKLKELRGENGAQTQITKERLAALALVYKPNDS